MKALFEGFLVVLILIESVKRQIWYYSRYHQIGSILGWLYDYINHNVFFLKISINFTEFDYLFSFWEVWKVTTWVIIYFFLNFLWILLIFSPLFLFGKCIYFCDFFSQINIFRFFGKLPFWEMSRGPCAASLQVPWFIDFIDQ